MAEHGGAPRFTQNTAVVYVRNNQLGNYKRTASALVRRLEAKINEDTLHSLVLTKLVEYLSERKNFN